MNIIEYLDSQVKKYESNNYKLLLLRFKSISNKIMTIYSELYLQIYKYCKDLGIIDIVELEGLQYPIFKYKLDSPCSKLYYDINNLQITKDEDILNLNKDIMIDRQMLKELEEAIHKEHFQKLYANSDLYINLFRFHDEMINAFDITFDSFFINAIQSLQNKTIIQAEGEVE